MEASAISCCRVWMDFYLPALALHSSSLLARPLAAHYFLSGWVSVWRKGFYFLMCLVLHLAGLGEEYPCDGPCG